MNEHADVVIIGGGVNGCAIAYYLSKLGMNVSVFERNYLGSGATGSCGAGIRQQWSTKENTELAIQSVHMFEELSDELGEDIEFSQGGYLIINHTEEELAQSKKNVKMQKTLGLDVSMVSVDEINDIVPVLDVNGMDSVGATFCPTDGHANPFKTTFAYAHAAEQLGANIHTHTLVKDIKTKNNQVSEVLTDKKSVKTRWVVDAAGAWSSQIAKMVGISIPNKPFRKEVLATERLEPLFKAMVISFKDGIYFSQQPEGNIVGGIPIPEQRSGFYELPTFSFIQHMSETLTRYAPALRDINMLRHWTGYYDVTPDARPILGEDSKVRGFVHCHGFSGHGFMLSPMVSRMLAEYISNDKESSVLKRLRLNRYEDEDIDMEQNVVG
ncbi:MAG: FAD-binding oxidoreductase [Candidatus Thermoplasmatota archaeon]|nr:FAD-binding oxidoreductase [Candidatus Thermoplasmatota archaeon]MBS3801171.1 FAD-binding oxidoreductase [Candidatus Thermoplasmatota archaeon]